MRPAAPRSPSRRPFPTTNLAAHVVTLVCNGTSVPVTVNTGANAATATFTTPATGAVACEYTNTALSQALTKAMTNNADGDNSGTVSLGDVLTYTVTVTNTSATGNLTNVVVSDSKITPGTTTCASVAPGATCVLVGTYTVTRGGRDRGTSAYRDRDQPGLPGGQH